MRAKSKKRIMNVVMIAVIAVIAAAAAAGTGYLKGWFGGGSAVMDQTSGIVSIERSGVAFTPKEDTKLRNGDILDTGSGAEAQVLAGSNRYILAEDTQLSFNEAEGSRVLLSQKDGEVFLILDKKSSFRKLAAGGYTLECDSGVFASDVQKGSMSIRVFSGSASISKGKKTKTADAGHEINIADGKMSVSRMSASALSDFDIGRLETAGKDHKLCFSSSELEKTSSARKAEIMSAQKELAHSSKVIRAGKSGDEKLKTCIISLRCETILDNMKKLTKSKVRYVPSDGVILPATTVEFKDGESVFDVLKRVCDAENIQLEYSYSPGYSNNYIEGINNLYEFDCGPLSGWTYKVNGWFPNYGCSGYKLKGSETIVWEYTCTGYGSDTGGGTK